MTNSKNDDKLSLPLKKKLRHPFKVGSWVKIADIMPAGSWAFESWDGSPTQVVRLEGREHLILAGTEEHTIIWHYSWLAEAEEPFESWVKEIRADAGLD